MTSDFLEDFITALENEDQQYIIVTVDKNNKDFLISHEVKDNETFSDILDILTSIYKGGIGGKDDAESEDM